MQLQNVKVSRDENAWEVEVKAEIPVDVLLHYRAHALKEIQRDAKLDGFRPGHAPAERIVQVYGESAILKEAVQRAIEHELPELLAAEKLPIIEAPRVTTEQPKNGKPLVFSARAALAPSVELPDYRAVASKHSTKEEISVSDDEHAQAMTHLRRERARIEKIEAGTEQQKAIEESRGIKAEELPALDDTFVQSLGYESAERFSEALRANIKTEKEMQAREKRRAMILDDLVKESSIKYPAALREYELDDMEARIKEDITQHAGQTFEGYLTHIKKTREQLRDEWKDAADKRAKVRLILTEIARKENIEPEEKALAHEIEKARKHYPQADPIALRAHIAHAMRNDAALRFLEGNPEKVGHIAVEH